VLFPSSVFILFHLLLLPILELVSFPTNLLFCYTEAGTAGFKRNLAAYSMPISHPKNKMNFSTELPWKP
jgi:hypothetical protein